MFDNVLHRNPLPIRPCFKLQCASFLRSGIPIWFSTAIYAFEGIGVVLPLENQMKEPQKMGSRFGAINIAMGTVTLLYTMMGFFGYWQLWDLPKGDFVGDHIEGSITLNLPQYDW